MAQLTTTSEWFYRMLGEEFGPVSRNVLDSLIADGQIGGDDDIRAGATGSWMPARQLSARPSSGNGPSNGSGSDAMMLSLESLSDVGVAAVEHGNSATSNDEWFYQSFSQEWGPISFDELLQHASQGDLSPDDQIRLGRNGKWRRAGSMGRLMAVMPYAVREVKTIPTGNKSSQNTDHEFDTTVTLRESAPKEVAPPPAPVAAALPPPPPPMPQMMPQPQVMTMMPPSMAPSWNPAMDMGWFAWLDGVECGPMDIQQIASWTQSGRISMNDYIKQGKYSQWTLAQKIQGLVFKPPPQPVPPPVAPAPVAAAPAVLPAVQLPPPPKPAPVPALAPAAVAPPPPRPVIPAPPPKPDFPTDAPPIRQWTNDWATSTVKSSYRPGAETAASPAAKKSSPVKSKKKSSGGGSLDVNELMKDKRVLGGLGVVVLIVAGYFGMGMLPEGTGKLKVAYEDLTKLHKQIEEKSGDSADAKKWEAYGKSLKTKLTNSTKAIGTSTHAAKTPLNSAKTALSGALSAKKPEDVEKKLKDAETKLSDAKKKLGL